MTGLILAVKKFEAVGDSLTAGENGAGPKPAFVDPGTSYPTKLQEALEATYPNQGIVVVNRGEPGKKVYETYERLPGFLNADRPEAVLLLSGYNNLTLPCAAGQGNTAACGAATEEVAIGVRDCIRETKESPVGVKFIFVSTLTPPGPSGRQQIDVNAIIEANRKIRQMVASERVTLVDTYPSFLGHEADYVSADGLHLRPAGYQAVADAFFAAIKATVPQTSPGVSGTAR